MEKGLSLAINQLILLIIAVVVLLVALGIIYGQMPNINEIKANQQRISLCNAYVKSDPKCEDVDQVEDEVTEKLANVCQQLRYPGCSGSLTVECVKKCCDIACPGTK
ncbi:MAG: hypothetical protein DRO96_00945 [Candidatus Aenigmatarchaeota archaeon]|nr:MAG: hypothetical protein DRO96_00945 [Candidatus Aenigmarchaeota archaeon]